MMTTINLFRSELAASGLEPPEVIEPGKLHRFPGVGKRRGNTAGWCKFFEDGRGGCFGDWSTGLSKHWQIHQKRQASHDERAFFLRRVKEAQEQAELEQARVWALTAEKARKIWERLPAATDNHPYLERKGIHAHVARLSRKMLVLPVVSAIGEMTSLQFIDGDGNKRLLANGRKRGSFMPISGNLENASRIIICEGFATGCTLAENEPEACVIAAIDAGNLRPVALNVRCRKSRVEIIIAGDDDRMTPGNPGATKAKDAAEAADCLLALPQWPDGTPQHLTDFNDLALWLAGRLK